MLLFCLGRGLIYKDGQFVFFKRGVIYKNGTRQGGHLTSSPKLFALSTFVWWWHKKRVLRRARRCQSRRGKGTRWFARKTPPPRIVRKGLWVMLVNQEQGGDDVVRGQQTEWLWVMFVDQEQGGDVVRGQRTEWLWVMFVDQEQGGDGVVRGQRTEWLWVMFVDQEGGDDGVVMGIICYWWVRKKGVIWLQAVRRMRGGIHILWVGGGGSPTCEGFVAWPESNVALKS